MKGHERLIEMRRKGWNPLVVTIEYGEPSGLHSEWAEQIAKYKQVTFPIVWVAASETPELLDLRFCQGVSTVILEGTGVAKQKLDRLFTVLQSSGAQNVLLRDPDEELRVWAMGKGFNVPMGLKETFEDDDIVLGGFDG